ncbi:Serine/threonine-protein kinase RIO1 [Blattella germanica]|nr:Serine/threonine-protein kinase RIO1 [Blattella germanica]
MDIVEGQFDEADDINYQPQEKQFKRYINKINVEKYEGPDLPNHAANLLIETNRKFENERIRTKDKHDRATAEQVMDPRTRMILFKLLNRGTISEINGCISTGKEANMVRTWAEKEMRNLVRMHAAGLPVPEPILLRGHVLLMEFIGKEGWPAPKLKDVELSESRARQLYHDFIIFMWRLYNDCKLVHADLSEFNTLYHSGQLYIIDVAQSVEHDHPHALEFLRTDCTNVSEFFRKKGVATMTVKELFDFITDRSITESNRDAYLDKMSERAAARTFEEMTAQEQIEEEVFKKAYIPKTLTEVVDIERDIDKAQSGGDLVYQTITGLKPQDAVPDESDDESSSDSEDEESNFVNSARPRDESPVSKKVRILSKF